MLKNGAYELTSPQIDQITKVVIAEPGAPGKEGMPNKQFVGKSPQVIAKSIGLNVPVTEFLPYIMRAVRTATDDLESATVAAGTSQCEHIVVFGSNRISQLASTVNAMLVFVAPLSLAMLLLAFLLSFVAYAFIR